MFYGRTEILNDLASLWRKKSASLVACRGRRRIGKSRTIEEFAANSSCTFISISGQAPAAGVNNATQLASFVEQLAAQSNIPDVKAETWMQAFRLLDAAIPSNGRTVVLLDEISWMGGYDSGFAGFLKTAWDANFKRHDHLVLILCGSVSAWIEKNILNSTGFVGRFSRDYVIGELVPAEARLFWGRRAERLDTKEIVDVLSVTGGVPKYLEEIDPSLSADENVRRLCFMPNGTLFQDFNEIFSSIFGVKAEVKRSILESLANGGMGEDEIAKAMGVHANGHLTEALYELSTAGFISSDRGVNPLTGRRTKRGKYRLKDNYSRFFLKFIRPHIDEIRQGVFRFVSLSALPGWNSILGLQFENLVLNNVSELIPHLGIGSGIVTSAAPFRSNRSDKGGGCQIDLLVQTPRTAYVVEVKRRREIGVEVEREVAEKIRRLPIRKGISVRTALVYDGNLDPAVGSLGFFDAIVSSRTLLGLGEGGK